MNDKDRNKLQRLISVYQRRIDNIEWHINANQLTGEQLNLVNQRLRDHKEFLSDLKSLV